MAIEILQFNESGQAFFDFDALEAKTSQKFAWEVRFHMEAVEKTDYADVVRVEKAGSMVTVVVRHRMKLPGSGLDGRTDGFMVHKYFSEVGSRKNVTEHFYVSARQVKLMGGLMQ